MRDHKSIIAKQSVLSSRRQTLRGLHKFQRLMASIVMQPLTVEGGMRKHWCNGLSAEKVAGRFIKPNARLTSFERLEIYNRQYWYRIKDCFYEDYPGLRAVLGERRFERTALAYLKHCPSECFALRNLGCRLVEFLQANPRGIKPLRKLALDMARLEWAHIEAFDSEAKPRLRPESLAGANPASLYMKLQPHVTLLHVNYEVDKLLIRVKRNLRSRNKGGRATGHKHATRRSTLGVRFVPHGIFVAVHRQDETVYYKRLERPQFCLLTRFRDGATVSDACKELAQSSHCDPSKVGKWFKIWASLGWFCEVE